MTYNNLLTIFLNSLPPHVQTKAYFESVEWWIRVVYSFKTFQGKATPPKLLFTFISSESLNSLISSTPMNATYTVTHSMVCDNILLQLLHCITLKKDIAFWARCCVLNMTQTEIWRMMVYVSIQSNFPFKLGFQSSCMLLALMKQLIC